jgi:hypothetical protein
MHNPHEETGSYYSDESTITSLNEEEMKKFRFYPSNAHGSAVVHARTGEKYPWSVGSFESLRLFRIINTTGGYNEHGKVIEHGSPPNRDPNFLYYDSPDDYEDHWRFHLNNETHDKWNSQVQFLFPGGEFSKIRFDELTAKYKLNLSRKNKAFAIDLLPLYNTQNRLEDDKIATFNKRHPEWAMGKMAPKELRDEVLNILIPGTTPASGKSMKSSIRSS